MQITLKILSLGNNDDIQKLRKILSNIEGIIACEINKNKKELNLIYDQFIISKNDIVSEVENGGFCVM